MDIKISGISPFVDSRTGTAAAEFEFQNNFKIKNPQTALPPIGTIGQATFLINQGEILLISETSLVYQEGRSMVRIMKNKNQFTKKQIELGEQRDGSYVVKSGLSKGDLVVIRSSRPLKEGESVEVEKNTPKAL